MLEDFAGWIVYGLLSMPHDGAAEVINYFIYDTLKVFILLAVMVFLVSIIRTFVTPEKVRKWLGGRREGAGNVLAALLGVPTPFCSCSAVPLFIGFLEAGVPLGITFSFLIASPLVNEVAIALLWGLFGWQVTALYIGTGLLIAIIAGITIGRLGLESQVEKFAYEMTLVKKKEKNRSWRQRIGFAKQQTLQITAAVGPYIILGVAIGALVHGLVPVGFLAEIAGRSNPFAVPIAVLIGVPLYSNAAGTIPIIQALMEKGMAMGTALALMMSITALSLPEMIILRKVLKPKLIAVFALILAAAFTFTGLLFNAVLG
ncbi:MAG: permease [Candidatus Micrarchaeota archaeon]|nr:permease [Candidatus Micrarchaeota archaeon]